MSERKIERVVIPCLISKDPEVCGGSACIPGTRITVWGLEAYRKLGWSDEKILKSFPGLTPQNLVAAWLYVAYHREEIEREIEENES